MSKKLSEMTLEELWQLFPIVLAEHNQCWANWYAEEVEQLEGFLPADVEYHHVGSTAIDGIMAKPIVDILVAVDTRAEQVCVAELLQKRGYIVMSSDERRISLNKGYTEQGFAERVFHLHVRLKNDVDEICFRDYLNAHPNVAKEYEKLKLSLWKQFEHDRDAYTAAKTAFVTKYTALGKIQTE